VWFASLPLAEFGLALRANGYSAFHGASRSPLPFDSSISKSPPSRLMRDILLFGGEGARQTNPWDTALETTRFCARIDALAPRLVPGTHDSVRFIQHIHSATAVVRPQERAVQVQLVLSSSVSGKNAHTGPTRQLSCAWPRNWTLLCFVISPSLQAVTCWIFG
jgi:hypothetical protein